MRSELVMEARLAAETIHHDYLNALTDNEIDLGSHEFLRLRNQFTIFNQAHTEYKYVYLLGRSDNGHLFFFLDSEPAGSDDEVLPGTLYEEAPEAMIRVFETGRPAASGPYTDLWGTFVTALAPVIDPGSGAVAAVVGVDIDAQNWRWMLARSTAAPALFTVCMMAILFAAILLLSRRSRLAGNAAHWMRHLEITAVVIVGLVLTVFVTWAVYQGEKHGRHDVFRQLALSRTFMIAETLQDIQNYELEGLGRFFEGSEYVDTEEFLQYTAYLTKNPVVQSWMGIAEVPEDGKIFFEANDSASAFEGFEIWQMDSHGRRISASGRDVYYPVSRIAPMDHNDSALGYDHGSELVHRTALEDSARTGLITATGPVFFGQDDRHTGIIIYRPVFVRGRPEQLWGFTAALLEMDKLLKHAVPNLDSTPVEINLLGPEGESRLLSSTVDPDVTLHADFSVTRPIFAYGKVFEVTAYADREFLRMHPAREPWFAGLTGITVTAAFGFILGMILRRREVLEKLVAERTFKLRESEEYLSATMRSIGDGVITCNVRGEVESLNTEAQRLTGWETSEAAGRPIEEICTIVHAHTREFVENPVVRSLQEGAVAGLANHTLLIDRKGREYQIADSCAPIFDTAEKIIGVVLVFRDITDEYSQQEKLDEERRRLDYILEATHTHINITDSQYNLRYVDSAWKKIYGDPEGRKCYEYFHDLDRPCDSCSLKKALETRKTVISEQVLRREGSRIIEVHSIPFQNTKGEWLAAEFNMDITERKRAEEETRKLQVQLLQSQKLESIGRLAGGIAHDFNNMLGVILGYTEMAIEKVPAEQQNLLMDLQEVQFAARRSSDLTRQLLAFASKQLIVPERFNLNERIDTMIKMLRKLIGEDVDLERLSGDSRCMVRMDGSQVDQILINLCMNAREAITDVGKITIETSLVLIDELYCKEHADGIPGEYILLSVSDSGTGMDEETISHAFEPFYTTKKVGEGTGLGLATVFGIVKQNNGFINVFSEPGEGTVFNIYLPSDGNEEDQVLKLNKPSLGKPGNETVLLVDDDVMVRILAARMLEQLGYTVIEAASPEEVLQLGDMHDHAVNLLVTDVVMPGMNGKDLFYALQEKIPHLRCLFMSGYTADIVLHRSAAGNGVRFLQKPFTRNELALKVREVLDSGTTS